MSTAGMVPFCRQGEAGAHSYRWQSESDDGRSSRIEAMDYHRGTVTVLQYSHVRKTCQQTCTAALALTIFIFASNL